MNNSLKNLNFFFERDINFLRAIAVLSVILFHSGFYSNGYLGVDIFFVISGYVITKILTKDFTLNKFSLTKFYIRRIKRLYPALILMVLISYFFYLFFGIVNILDFNAISKTAASGLLGLSNIYFLFRDQNYFTEDGNNFLLHLWSLGIEEQYYLIYPIFLFTMLKLFKSLNIIIYAFIFTLIILFFIRGIDHNLFNNFFSPLFRFNELFLGCLAFFVKSKIKIKYEYFNLSLILVLLLTIFTNILNFELINEISVVCVLTFLILISENKTDNFFSNIIRSKFFFLIGDISYSMYLWHLPIVYFLNMFFINNYTVLFLVLSSSFGAGFISRKYLEIPIINKNFDMKFNKKILLTSLMFILISLGINYNSIYKNANIGIYNFFNFSKNLNIYYDFKENNKLDARLLPNYKINNNILDDHCFFDRKNFNLIENGLRDECSKIDINNKEKIFIVYGDCHALHFAPMVNTSKLVKNVSFMGDISISSLKQDCLINDKCDDELSKQRKLYYLQNIKTINQLSKEYKDVYIVLKFLMSDRVKKNDRYENNLIKFIKDLNNNINILIIKQTPVFKNNISSCFANEKFCYRDQKLMLKEFLDINKVINNIGSSYQNVNIIDMNKHICDGDSCKYYDRYEDFIYFRDNDNISNEFSLRLSQSFNEEVTKLIDR